jgi:ATP-dependent DNA ligase I
MLFEEIARTSTDVGAARARLAKVERLADCLGRIAPDEVAIAVAFLSGSLPQGTIGVGWAALRDLPPPATLPSLRVLDVHAALERIRVASGMGSQAVRRRELSDLFGRTTEHERRFLIGLLQGELRQGAQAGVMVEAVAKAAAVPPSDLRRAVMLAGDLGVVARAAIAEGPNGLNEFRLSLLRPVQPMLAQTAEDVDEALARVAPAAVEWKLDGARIQVHRVGGDVRVFTRNLADVTARVPEVVEATLSLPLEAVLLDGEAIALLDDGRPRPFQVTMSRFGSRLAVDDLRRSVPLSAFFFDCLHLDGEDLIDLPAAERFEALARGVPDAYRVQRAVVSGAKEAQGVFEDALARGHEGVMVKALAASYEAGRRGASWLKVKKAHTLDLVVLAAEWGHGRRRGWLSNLHLGARDPAGGFVMLGKTFKGMTDEMLTWQTERLLELETGRDKYTVHVRPELMVEVAFDGIQTSRRYPGGVALRFARVKGYRLDKRPAEADTIETVQALHTGGASDP